MGRRTDRQSYEHKKVTSEELIKHWKDPTYKDEIEKASVQFARSVDPHTLESLKWEGLWKALATYRTDTNLWFKYWVYRKVRWTIMRHIQSQKKREQSDYEDEECSSRPTKGNQFLDYENKEMIDYVLGRHCCRRDLDIFYGYLEGYTAVELADQHSCGKKNVHRIITRCKGLIKKNATRVDLSR